MTGGSGAVSMGTPQHRRIARGIGAIAGLTSALSLAVGVLAAHFAPSGWHRLSVALHLSRQPLIVRLAPMLAASAVVIAAAAGLVSFYSWCMERPELEGSEEQASPPEPR